MRVEGWVASIYNNTAPRHAVCVFVATGWGTQKVELFGCGLPESQVWNFCVWIEGALNALTAPSLIRAVTRVQAG